MADVISNVYTFYNEVSIPDNMRRLLTDTETPLFAVKTFRDTAVFTDKRILIGDKQGITGKKIEYATIPYKSIITYAIETAGTFDLDAEIKLTLSGGIRIELQFLKDKNMNQLLFRVYDTITKFVIV
ncbi:PH domain-containing protein [Clostridium swellfunianum]|uniref:PH domain-containing protein n=1 Tax=Clostridium swellfunianum TaxID=1367462 RepID=UPI00202F9346|nr:PH domain-containing protein [Clostridium swellfunianum]MCM0647927.1 PH domain-containing protein [Clostridium swellfunianum]